MSYAAVKIYRSSKMSTYIERKKTEITSAAKDKMNAIYDSVYKCMPWLGLERWLFRLY